MSTSPNMQPPFPDTLVVGRAALTTANTDHTGVTTSNMVTLYSNPAATSGGKGARFDRIEASAPGATVAGLVRLFLYDGTLNWPLFEITVALVASPSTTVPAWHDEVTRSDDLPVVHVPPGYALKATTTITQAINLIAWGGEY